MKSLIKDVDKDKIREFYSGRIYPLIIAFLVTLGAVTGFEVMTLTVHAVLLFGALLLSDSIKPVLISIVTFVYQVSVKNSPQYPNYSDYYLTGWRVYVLSFVIAIIFAGLVIFSVRNKIFSKVSLKTTPLLIPTLIFCVSMLTSGLFSGEWVFKNLIFGVANCLIYLLVFLLVYHGFSKNDTSSELASYFSYIAALAGIIISVQIIHLMLTADNVFIDGSINKVAMALGWGIWNLVAVSLAILIPLIFYGMYTNKYPWFYFAVATVCYVMSVLTMSRNALVFSTLTYGACVIISCFVGRTRKAFRIITLAGIVGIIVFAIVFWDKIYMLLGDYFERGFSDNGRFDLWRGAFSSFLGAPIFGAGFYGLDIDYGQFGFLPHMAHQTVLQLLGSMGIFGICAYGYYRYKTCLFVFRKPNLLKTMLALSILTLLCESMLDNFIFNFYPVFYYVVALAIICKNVFEEGAGE